MVLLSVLIAVLAVIFGPFSSLYWDLPAGPPIVVAAACLFFVSRVFVR